MIALNRVLIIRFSSLGDIILLTPLFREINHHFPGVKIDFLTSTTFAGVCANNPHINQIIAIDRKEGFLALKRFVSEHPHDRYDLIIDAHRSLRSRLLLIKWLGIFSGFSRKTVSIDKRSLKRNILLLTGINRMKNAISQREVYLSLISHLTDHAKLETGTELYPDPKEKERVLNIIREYQLEGKKIAALGPGASYKGKCWPQESFLELSEALQKAGYPVILLGSGEETEPHWICENSSVKPLNLAGKLSFLETAALLEYCSLVVSNDSAVVHFAEAMKVPALAIFGPTVREFGYAPFLTRSRTIEIDLKCRPCSRNGKGKCTNPIQRQCLRDIKVQTVFKAALQTLN
ncbi:MAG: glycosyltransferase family 9 protein [SAR324 cluster bacterium]|nr:glycosyltransferase family 9 protein [SAR324 cluster bacterium]